MPCTDVSELLTLRLDAEDRLEHMTLAKGTCGAPVGDAVLLGFARGERAEHLQHAALSDIVPRLEVRRSSERFLLEKQLFALQAALAALAGAAPAGRDDLFTIERVAYDADGGTELRGFVDATVKAEAVPGCKTCGCSDGGG